MKSVNLYIPLLLLLFLAGACGTKKSDGASGALSDDALLDTVQHRTFNYFWDGAEPNSGLARERIHMDGVYPENDQKRSDIRRQRFRHHGSACRYPPGLRHP